MVSLRCAYFFLTSFPCVLILNSKFSKSETTCKIIKDRYESENIVEFTSSERRKFNELLPNIDYKLLQKYIAENFKEEIKKMSEMDEKIKEMRQKNKEMDEKNKEMDEKNKEMRQKNKELDNRKEFVSLMCAMHLIRENLHLLLERLGLKAENFTNSSIDNDPDTEGVLSICKRILPSFNEDANIRSQTLWLYQLFNHAFSNGIKSSNLTNPTLRNLVTSVGKINCPIWKAAATGAAIRKLSYTYMHYKGPMAVRIFIAYAKMNTTSSIRQIIKKYNSWKVTKRDMDIINAIMTSTGGQKIDFVEIIDKNGMEVVLPLQDPIKISRNCLP